LARHGRVGPRTRRETAKRWFEKVSLKIAPEWNLIFPTERMPSPIEGIRRALVNSFGYGSKTTTAHAILDDAYHFLVFHNLIGKHSAVIQPQLSAHHGDGMNGKIDGNKHVAKVKRAVETEVINGSQ
jgi:hypothetical protein